MTMARGRNSVHIMPLVAELHARQVYFVASDLGIDTATSAGRLVLGIFAVLVDYDRKSIRERAIAGFVLAKAQLLGRRPTYRNAITGGADPSQRGPARNPGAGLPAVGLGRPAAGSA